MYNINIRFVYIDKIRIFANKINSYCLQKYKLLLKWQRKPKKNHS